MIDDLPLVGDWWMEENGLLMESPDFPLPEGQYLVTGGRETQAVLKVSGDSWSLSHEAKLSDVTHLPCRSARSGEHSCADAISSTYLVANI